MILLIQCPQQHPSPSQRSAQSVCNLGVLQGLVHIALSNSAYSPTHVSFKPPPSLLPTAPSSHTIFLLFHPHYLHHTIFSLFNLADFMYVNLAPSWYLARPLTLSCMPNLVHSHSQCIDTHFTPTICSGFLSHDLEVQHESNINIITSRFLTSTTAAHSFRPSYLSPHSLCLRPSVDLRHQGNLSVRYEVTHCWYICMYITLASVLSDL